MHLTTEYKEEYAQIAFDKLSKVPLRDERILCLVFRCSVETLSLWKAEHSTFNSAIELGLMSGEYKFRALLFSFALLPAAQVNTKLLTLLASNVYKINEDQVQKVLAAFGSNLESLEERLIASGLPIPQIDAPDMED